MARFQSVGETRRIHKVANGFLVSPDSMSSDTSRPDCVFVFETFDNLVEFLKKEFGENNGNS